MASDQDGATDDPIDRAKAGAKRLAGWLGKRLEQAAETVRESETVQGGLSRLQQAREEQEARRRLEQLDAWYQRPLAAVGARIEAFEQRLAGFARVDEAVNVNISDLRLRGVGNDDAEMRDYQRQLTEIREHKRALELLIEPLRQEASRLERVRRAGLTQLDAGTASFDELVAEAQRQQTEAAERLAALGDLPAPEEADT